MDKLEEIDKCSEMSHQVSLAPNIREPVCLVIDSISRRKDIDMVGTPTRNTESTVEDVAAVSVSEMDNATTHPMEGVPVEVLTHILTFCDIRQVCVCMSVCKKWECAARAAIRTRRHVVLFEHNLNGKYDGRFSHSEIMFGGDEESEETLLSMLNCLNQMVSLRTLLCPTSDRFEQIAPVVMRNASTLTTLVIGADLPHDGQVLYGNLEELECNSLSEGAASACPILRKLKIWGQDTGSMFLHLPPQTMSEFEANNLNWTDDQNVRDFESGISALCNLEKLHIHECYGNVTGDSLQRMLAHGMQLTHFQIDYANDKEVDAAVANLVEHNPQLEIVILTNAALTDETLISFSRLRNLVELHVETSGTGVFSVDAVITLLTGGPRLTLQTLWIKNSEVTNWDAIELELGLIGEERGREMHVQTDLLSLFSCEFD